MSVKKVCPNCRATVAPSIDASPFDVRFEEVPHDDPRECIKHLHAMLFRLADHLVHRNVIPNAWSATDRWGMPVG